MSGFDRCVAQMSRLGSTTYAQWDAQAYARLTRTASTLWERLGEDGAPQVEALRAYLRLGQEALARGLLIPGAEEAEEAEETVEPEGLLARLWLHTIPAQAASVPVEQLPAILVDLWNLAQGLRGEGLWLDRAVGPCLDETTALGSVEATIATGLEALFSSGSEPDWARLWVGSLDLRPVASTFIPGRMHLLAPRVVCIHDRRSEDECVGLRLGEGGGELLGCIDCGEPHEDSRPLPPLDWSMRSVVRIGERAVDLPLLGQVHASLPVPDGYIVASAVDSQRLWVVACE